MWGTMSILGLYNFDTSIFSDLVLPDGVDSTTAINSIITDNAELEIIYPDPTTMKFMIKLWSERELPIWERVLQAINTKYNPIENYNRTESWKDTDTGSNSASSNSTDTHKVVGYNDTSFTNADQNTGTASGSGSSKLESVHEGNVKGNIGVTTSQQMLNQEFDVSKRLDIYKYISESFKNRFCLMVY